MRVKDIFAAGAGLALLAVSASAAAQTFTIGEATVTEGVPQVAVDWSLTAGSDMSGAAVDIAFDGDFISPVLGEGNAVEGCLENVTAPNQACNVNPAGTIIRVTLQDFVNPLEDASGTITFDIDPDAVEGDSTDLALSVFSVVPTDVEITLVEGSVTIVGTDAVLTLDPDSVDFGTQDILAPPQTAEFTIGNDGDQDSLIIDSAAVGGAPFSVTANCDGEELAPGETCVVVVTFEPQEVGAFSDVLTVESDAGTVTAALSGEATAEANVEITPPFGPVDLGFGLQGETLTATGSVQNTGSADATLVCNFDGDDVFSTDLPLATTIDVIAGADPIGFEVNCDLPADAEDGDTFAGEIQCSIDGAPVDDTTHFLSCGVSEFEPLPVPTMQNWALILFAMLMLLVGGISIRMFRS